MAKKKSTPKTVKAKSVTPVTAAPQAKIPPELEKTIKALQKKLEEFKTKLLDKFGDYINGITVLPPEKPKQGEKADPEKEKLIDILVIVDDTTSKKMSKDELHQRFTKIVTDLAKEIDKNFRPQAVLLTDFWQNSFDSKYDLNKLISISAPVYDPGLLGAIKIVEIHKSMVMKKFDKYIQAYVLIGSVPRGKATPTSDIDVWIVIDDTDVKKMTRVELKDKLRAIIMGMAVEAGEITGIKNKLSCQVHILTDVWDSLKEANPVVFTFLRDGVPFFDRGVFTPWKQLLKMGRIKPSREAIDLFMNTGEQSIKRVKKTLRILGMEDTFYAILTPSQAALMLYGLPPPTPHETAEVMEEVFVKKEKMLEPQYIKILNHNVELRKQIEHGEKKSLTGTEVEKLVKDAEKYLKRIKKLFKEIEEMHDQKSILYLYDEVLTIIRDVLRLEGIEKAKDTDLLKIFEEELVESGKVPARYLRDVEEIVSAKKKHEQKKLTRADIDKARKGSSALIKFLVEYMQRKRGRALERAKIRVKHGNKFGEVLVLDKEAFVIFDIDAKEQKIEKAKVTADGGLGPLKAATFEEFEHALAAVQFPERVFIKEQLFEDLKNIFGRHVEVLVQH